MREKSSAIWTQEIVADSISREKYIKSVTDLGILRPEEHLHNDTEFDHDLNFIHMTVN